MTTRGRIQATFVLLPSLSVTFLVGACQRGPAESAYVERLGNDTLSIEVYTRTDSTIEGRVLTRSPVTRVANYHATLSPDGRITRLAVDVSTPAANPDGPPTQHVVTTIEGDSAVMVRQEEGADPDTVRLAVPPGTMPTVSKTFMPIAFIEHAVRSAGTSDSFAFSLLPAGRQRLSSNAIVRHTRDTVKLDFFGSPVLAKVDADGQVLGLTGRHTTVKVETERATKRVNLDVLAADFAARDAKGEGLGTPSPRATVNQTAAGATFEVDYSRPAKRGREIFGGLVSWNAVWRTGANAATHFTTDRDLEIDGTTVPAGTYTLWTTFTPESATLIINQETGQWGTAYNAEHDFLLVPMERRMLDEPVERFTISFAEEDGNAVMKLSWDVSEFSVAMRVIE